MKNRNLDHSDNWATPAGLYDELNKEFNFDFDPCPLNDGEIINDGLTVAWGYRNFVNPPYSRKLKESFIKKAIEETKNYRLSVCLIPVSTSTSLFHDFIKPNAKEIRFIRGRVRFGRLDERGKLYTPKQSGMHDSMIVIFKP